MRVFTYSEARKRLAEVLDMAREDEVIIRRRNGDTFSLTRVQKQASVLDIDGFEVDVTTQELVAAVRESREDRGAWKGARSGTAAGSAARSNETR